MTAKTDALVEAAEALATAATKTTDGIAVVNAKANLSVSEKSDRVLALTNALGSIYNAASHLNTARERDRT